MGNDRRRHGHGNLSGERRNVLNKGLLEILKRRVGLKIQKMGSGD